MARLEKTHVRLGNIRLAVALSFVIIVWSSLRAHSISTYWIAAPVVVFAGIAFHHSRVLREQELAKRAADFCERGLARTEDRWMGTGETGARFEDPHHVYASDLDLFGDASLFQLLSAARTRIGEDTLADWLLAPAKVEEILQRHAAVSELRGELDLREDLAVLGEDARVGVHPAELVSWAELAKQMKWPWMVWLAPVLAALAVFSVIVWAIWDVISPLVIVIAVEAFFTYSLRRPIEAAVHGAEKAFQDLELLSGLMARLEAHAFRGARLQELQRELMSGDGVRASQAIARLRAVVDFINSRHNVFVRIIDAPLMYSVQVAFAAERWRKAHGKAVSSWLSVVGEIEALLSLAAYSYEHPDDQMPEFVEGAASFDARELGHPLLP